MTTIPRLPVKWRQKSYTVEPLPNTNDSDRVIFDHYLSDIMTAAEQGKEIALYPMPSSLGQNYWCIAVFVESRYLRDIFRNLDLLSAMNWAERLAAMLPRSLVVSETVRSATVALNPMKGSDLDPAVEPQPWLVPGLIPAREVSLLSGDGGVNKSTLAQQLCTATALGRPWLGHSVLQGRSLFITSEDDIRTVNRRQLAICAAEGVDLSEIGDIDFVSLAGQDALLGMLDHDDGTIQPTSLFEMLNKRVMETAPRVIVLDTLAGMYGGDENSRAHTRQFVSLLYRLVQHHSSTIILIGHPSLGGMSSGSGLSGSTDWHNAVRARLFLDRVLDGPDKAGRMFEPDPDARLLSTKKLQYGPKVSGIRLRFCDGVLVKDDQISLPGPGAEIETQERAEAKFIELLGAFAAEGRNVSDAGPTYAPTKFSKDERRDGVTKAQFAAAMSRLFAKGRIKMAAYGPPSKSNRRIEKAG